MRDPSLLDTARPIVERRAKRLGLSAADRQDVLQDVVLKYLLAFPDNTPDNAAAWFERTTERVLIDRDRASRRRPGEPLPELGDPHAVQTLVDAWREATATSLGAIKHELVNEALALIGEADREMFVRRFLHREPSRQIAADLGITVNTVDQRARRARKRLADALSRRPDLLTDLASPHPRIYG